MCPGDIGAQDRILRLALGLNLAMFVIGLSAGLVAHSSALIADSLDMLADAVAYAVALIAQRRDPAFKVGAARASGLVLLALGCAVLADVVRRAAFGADADGAVMSVIASLSFATNLYVFHKLSAIKSEGVHLRAAWIFTRADVIANLCVFTSGFIVWITGFSTIDLIVGAAIAIYVLKEAFEISFQAGGAKTDSEPS